MGPFVFLVFPRFFFDFHCFSLVLLILSCFFCSFLLVLGSEGAPGGQSRLGELPELRRSFGELRGASGARIFSGNSLKILDISDIFLEVPRIILEICRNSND